MNQSPTVKDLFYLDPTVTYLNFASFGACPKPIFENYQHWQVVLEKEPVQFITVDGLAYLQASRHALGTYLHADADDLVFVTNPSYAVNIVANSMRFNPGDEILTTNLEYGACDKAWQYHCDKQGAAYVRQPIRLPLTTKENFMDDFFKGISPKTKMVFISHITSSTALILPVKEICAKAKSLGLLTFVDGAHAPAHVAVNLSELQADFYTGACHKWMMCPKGSSFLYAKREQQHMLDPLVVSWGYRSAYPSHSQFLDYHQMQGTRDFSAFLTVPAALAFMAEQQWDKVSASCKQLVLANAPRFIQLLESKALCPLTDEFIGQMLSLPIVCANPEKLQKHLFEHYRMEVPVMRLENQAFIRFSINAFNTQADLDTLYTALQEIKSNGVYLP
jgi:isopenicillin-N epimerase